MRVTTKLAGFLLALVAAFGAAIVVRTAVSSPVTRSGTASSETSEDGESGDQHCGEAH
jgi:hypothetical protein